MSRKLLKDEDQGEYFVGYLDTPKVDRRYLLGLTVLGLAAAGGGAAGLAVSQRGAGGGSWDMAAQHTLTGHLRMDPYPMLLTEDLGGGVRTVLLACDTKCGAQSKLEEAALETDRVSVRGSLLERGRHTMMAVSNDGDWIQPADLAELDPAAADTEFLGEASLRGEILDSKCWFGAMRPNEGAAHKACAMLCIAGGIAPYFYARDRLGRQRAMMITDPDGGALVQPILRYVADPVAANGQMVRVNDVIQFRFAPEQLRWV